MCKRIACIVVTYNRKEMLKRCLDAIMAQRCKPWAVYITDNASTDGTIDSVKEWGLYNTSVDGVEYKYILNEKNEGGAGGFFKGMKTAFEEDYYDGFWVMDDDGVPEENCLATLKPYLSSFDYIAPLVLSDEDGISCSFTLNHEPKSEFEKNAVNGIVANWASPFNGILYSHKLVEKIGFPKKEMFIWGDEINYDKRAKNAGFSPITVVGALHYHPLNKQIYLDYKKRVVVPIEQDWKLYCYIRNSTYNAIYVRKKDNEVRYLFEVLRNIYRCLKDSWCNIEYYKKECGLNRRGIIMKAYLDGVFKNFRNLKKYMR